MSVHNKSPKTHLSQKCLACFLILLIWDRTIVAQQLSWWFFIPLLYMCYIILMQPLYFIFHSPIPRAFFLVFPFHTHCCTLLAYFCNLVWNPSIPFYYSSPLKEKWKEAGKWVAEVVTHWKLIDWATARSRDLDKGRQSDEKPLPSLYNLPWVIDQGNCHHMMYGHAKAASELLKTFDLGI